MDSSNKFEHVQQYLNDLIKSDCFNASCIFDYFSRQNHSDLLTIYKFMFGPGRDKKFILKISESNINEFSYWLLVKNNSPAINEVVDSLKFQEQYILPFVKSHSATFLNTTSKNSFLSLEKNSSSFIDSSNIINEKYLSYTGDTRNHPKRFFLETCFYYNNKLTSFLNLINDWDETKNLPFLNRPEERIALLEIKNKIVHSSIISDTSPQILFPLENSYIAINPLPSFAVLNSIKSELNNFRNINYKKTTKRYIKYVPQEIIHISPNNPANPSTFNSDNNGQYNMLKNFVDFNHKYFDKQFFKDKETLVIKNYSFIIDYKNPYDSINDFILMSLSDIFYLRFKLSIYYENIKQSNIHIKEKSYIYNKSLKYDLTYFINILWNNYKELVLKCNEIENKELFLKKNSSRFSKILEGLL